MKLSRAFVELILDGKIRYLPPQNIYYRGEILQVKGEKYLPGTLIIDTGGNDNDPTKWHILYLPPKARRLLPVRLFLFDEIPDIFERVYPPQGTSDPRKYAVQIWKIRYPEGIEERAEYLKLSAE